jgi:hypothetical protein
MKNCHFSFHLDWTTTLYQATCVSVFLSTQVPTLLPQMAGESKYSVLLRTQQASKYFG